MLLDGFDALEWYRDWGARFKVRELFEYIGWEFGANSSSSGEARVLCPNDNQHSSTGDIGGCWIKDGNGCDPFFIYCHHQSCSGLRTLDFLVRLEMATDLPDGYSTFSEMLCDPSLYESCSDPDIDLALQHTRYVRWDPRTHEEISTGSNTAEDAQ